MSTLPDSRYVSLTTYRRSGVAVPTPVWAAPDGGDLVVWTRADSGKVKRLRHTSRVTVAPCDVRGNLQGEAVEAQARLLPPESGRPRCGRWPAATAGSGGSPTAPGGWSGWSAVGSAARSSASPPPDPRRTAWIS